MPFRESKEAFEKFKASIIGKKKAEQELECRLMELQIMFEVYGELSSLAVSYKKMLELTQERMKGAK